jgi:glycosyltransferase involved in cell wall biosynthesis
MIQKLINRLQVPKKREFVESLVQKINLIRKAQDTIVLYGAPTEGNWKGIANATVGLYPLNSLEVPQWYSNAVLNKKETEEICNFIQESNFKKIIISGFAPYFFDWIELLNLHTKIEVIYHGTISEFHDVVHQQFIAKLISFGQSKKIRQFGFVKEGLAEVFAKLYKFDCVHRPLNLPVIPNNINKLKLDSSKFHIGVFGADTFNKNLHNQVIHALMFENVVVHVLDKTIFKYLGMDERIIGHGKNLPREQFLSILASMDLNLYMSFNESWGLVTFESEALGVPCLVLNKAEYFNLMNEKIESRK